MFKVKDIVTSEVVTVYSVLQNKQITGEKRTDFLVYGGKEYGWSWCDASYYIPLNE